MFAAAEFEPQTEVIVAYIDQNRERVVEGWRIGVEPIIGTLSKAGVEIAPSTYSPEARPCSEIIISAM